jgi:hypothetical protein
MNKGSGESLQSHKERFFTFTFRTGFLVFLGFAGFTHAGSGFFFFSKEAEWKDIPPEQLALEAPLVLPDAGVEALFIEMEVDESDWKDTVIHQYIRLKIFNDHGLRTLDKIDLFNSEWVDVSRIAARVIRRDGSIRELEKSEIFEREVIRFESYRGRLKSFSFPGLEVGCIVEYQWESRTSKAVFTGIRPLAYPDPAHLIRIRIKPFERNANSLLWINFGSNATMREEKSGFREVEVRNYKPFPKIDYPPPEMNTIPWFASSYVDRGRRLDSHNDYWAWMGESLYYAGEDMIISGYAPVRKVTAELVAGISDETEQLRRIYEFVQNEITNTEIDLYAYTPEEKDGFKRNYNAKQVLRAGYGTPTEILVLFASMAEAAGFEVRFARCANRGMVLFSRTYTHPFMVPGLLAAVKTSSGWQFHNPGNRYLPFGELPWQQTAVQVLVAAKDEALFLTTPSDHLGASRIDRRADMVLAEDGAIEGAVTIKLTGSEALRDRHEFDGMTQQELTDKLLEEIRKSYPRADISNVRMKNLLDLDKPLTLSYHLVIPEYADATPNRLFLNAAIFSRSKKPPFAPETRELDIYFGYPMDSVETVCIRLPEGFKLEDPSMPQSLGNAGFAEHRLQIGMMPDGRLGFRRRLFIATPILPAEHYPVVRNFFLQLQHADQHLMALHKEADDS